MPSTVPTTRLVESGKLTSLDNQVDTTTGTVKFRAEFPNKNLALFPNQFVNARLLVNTLKQRHAGSVRRRAAQRHRRVRLHRAAQQHGLRAAGHHADQQRAGHRRAGSRIRASLWRPADSTVSKTARRYRCAAQNAQRPGSTCSRRVVVQPHESLAAIHPSSGRYVSADGCDLSGGRRGVPAASGVGAAGGGLPDHSGAHLLPRCQSGRGCLGRDRSPGAAVRLRSPDSAR